MRISILLLAALSGIPARAQEPAIKLRVDATDAARRLIHARMSIPARPGPMTLLYPEWIPGEHAPTGPITNLVGLVIRGGEVALAWKRDSVNMYAFHVEVPAGVSTLEVSFDFISPPEAPGFSSGSSITTELAVLSWNQLVLFPEGVSADNLRIEAGLRVPKGWRYGSALPIRRESGDQIEFEPASLNTLIDSPVSAGAHYRTVDLGPGHYLHLAADSSRATEAPAERLEQYRNLVAETGALFGARHYRDYHFLLTLSDHVAHFGLEHHESSDNRLGERALVDEAPRRISATLLSHEFVHSWNGKFRRPAGLAPGHYDTAMQGDLLWVYEGLTTYLGNILAPRSGLRTPEDYREALALDAAALDQQTGRRWRPLEDTAVAAQTLYGSGPDYTGYRRNVDYYPEGALIWLDADVTIRRLSNSARSLDDFCRAFFGGSGGRPEVKTYEFADVVAALNAVQPYDWKRFLEERVRKVQPRAPLGGIGGSGWKLAFDGVRSEFLKAEEETRKMIQLAFSIGLQVQEDGTISDVALDSPSGKAGVVPASKIIAVNRRQYSPVVLREAVQKTVSEPLELLVKSGEYYETYRLDYSGGERYPHLVRDSGAPDLLSKIIAPKR